MPISRRLATEDADKGDAESSCIGSRPTRDPSPSGLLPGLLVILTGFPALDG